MIPKIAKSLGIGVGEFKKSFKEAAGLPGAISDIEKQDMDKEAHGQEQRK